MFSSYLWAPCFLLSKYFIRGTSTPSPQLSDPGRPRVLLADGTRILCQSSACASADTDTPACVLARVTGLIYAEGNSQ